MRARRLYLDPDMFVRACTDGIPRAIRVAAHALPPECVVINVTYDWNRGGCWVFVAHDSFEDVKTGDVIPVHPDPLFEEIR